MFFNLKKILRKTKWLEDSDTKISYVDELGQTRVMNVLTGQTDPLGIAEQRVIKQDSVPWIKSDHGWKREISQQDFLARNYPAVWECWLNCWILRYILIFEIRTINENI